MPVKKVVITIGDPCGCGPAITLAAINHLKKENIEFFVAGDKQVLEKIPGYKKVESRINLSDVKTEGIDQLKPGVVSKVGGAAALGYLKEAIALLKREKIKRLVTAPLSKEAVKLVFPEFKGHTEYLADYFKTDNFAMMMVSQKLKTVLFTRHDPLRRVSSFIKKPALVNLFSLVFNSLEKTFGIKAPRIAVVSLNPHAGINTFLDKEDKIIHAAVKESAKRIYGPFPSDTIFTQDNLKKFDCVVCLYHDQAMIPFKLLSFKKGVNLTLGLPIIRTSPAHGVAYEIIREGQKPFSSSMIEAVKLAVELK